jgi:uncharacterized MnhB-related membrane protein
MTIGFALDCGLAALIAAVAGWTIVARASFAAVVGFVAFGLLLTLVWVRLDAIDVAMTEAAIGSGLTGALLLGAAARLRAGEFRADAESPNTHLRVAAAVLSATVAAALASTVLLLPDPAPTLAPAAAENAAATGLGNPVSACGRWRPIASGAGVRRRRAKPIPMARSRCSRGCCRRWASSSASTSFGRAPIIPAGRSRAAPSSLRCGCWS